MNSKLHVEAHLTEEILIRFLDGELDKRTGETAARHLESCWTCRSKREQLRLAMDRFVQLEEALIDASITAPPRAWAGFRQRLNEIATPPPAKRNLPGQFTHAMGMLGAALACAIWLMPPSSVSAMEILERSAAAERPLFKETQNPLVLQRLRVESADRAASWSMWNAPRSGRFQRKWDGGDDRLRSDLEQMYSDNGLDLQHPLSAANHSRWRHSLRRRNDAVLELGELVEVVTVSQDPLKAGDIAEAELWVRRSDWHPVKQAFRVAALGTTQEYRIVETAFHVEALDAENARIFDPAPAATETTPLRTRLAISTVETSAPDVPLAPRENELIEAEIEALALLHEMDADRQDSAQVQRVDNRVKVTAYTSSEDRKLELESHLAAMPLVVSAIHLLSEASTEGDIRQPISIPAAASTASEPPLFLKELVQQAGELEIANRIVSDQMDLLRRLCIELDAVRDLEKRFPAEMRLTLSARSLSRLDTLALDHLDAARQVWLELERNAAPLISAMGVADGQSGAGTASCGEWYRPQAIPVSAADRLEDLYARAFTVLAGAPADISRQSILGELPELRATLTGELAAGCLR